MHQVPHNDSHSGSRMNSDEFDEEFDTDRPMSDRSIQIKSLLEQIFNEDAELLERLKDK